MKANKINVESVSDYTIEVLLDNVMQVKRVRELINLHFYDTDSRLRAALIISGQIEEPSYIPLNAVFSRKDGDIIGTFKSYDIFSNNVNYEYPNTTAYYFKNKEEADYYAKTGDRYKFSCKSTPDKEYTFEGIYTYTSTSNVSLESWIDHQVKDI